MKTIKIIIISLLVGLNLTSCDFLEKDPTYTTPENFFKNEADATSWLTGTYAILGQSSFYGNEFLYLVTIWDTMVVPTADLTKVG